MVSRAGSIMKRGPDVYTASKSAEPVMTTLRPTVPVSVPVPATVAGGTGDVSVGVSTDVKAVEGTPDARMNQPNGSAGTAAAPDATKPAEAAPAPAKGKKAKKKSKKQEAAEAAAAKAANAAPKP